MSRLHMLQQQVNKGESLQVIEMLAKEDLPNQVDSEPKAALE